MYKQALWNIIASMFSFYVDMLLFNIACIGHRVMLMYMILDFATQMGPIFHQVKHDKEGCQEDPTDVQHWEFI